MTQRQFGGDRVPEPVAVNAHHPLLMNGYGAFELAFRALAQGSGAAQGAGRDEGGGDGRLPVVPRLRLVAEPGRRGDRGAAARPAPLPRERRLRRDDEKLVLEYAEGISKTPAEVPDELFDAPAGALRRGADRGADLRGRDREPALALQRGARDRVAGLLGGRRLRRAGAQPQPANRLKQALSGVDMDHGGRALARV